MSTTITHKGVRRLGFKVDFDSYVRGNISLNVVDDDDRNDVFFASVEGKEGSEKISTFEQLEALLEEDLIELQ